LASTTVAALLYERGAWDLDDKLASDGLFGPAYSVHGKQDITVRNLLLHNAGFPPDPTPEYWDQNATNSFCPSPLNPMGTTFQVFIVLLFCQYFDNRIRAFHSNSVVTAFLKQL